MGILDKVEIHHAMGYDFLASIFRFYNHEKMMTYDQKVLDERFKSNEAIIAWVKETEEKVPEEIKEKMEIFFNWETYFGLCLTYYIAAYNPKDIIDFINYIEKISYKELLLLFIDTGYGPRKGDVSPELINKLLKDEKEAVDFINKHLSLPSQNKWELLQFFINPQKMQKELVYLLRWFYDHIYRQEENTVKDVIIKAERDLTTKIKKYGEDYVKLLTGVDYSKEKKDFRILIGISYYYEFSKMAAGVTDHHKSVYMIGYRYPQAYVEGKHAVLSNVQMFKALADETRLNMIKLLGEKSWYGKELAERLDLSNSTVSYHLSMLVTNHLVTTQQDNHKTYFSLDKKRMKEIITGAIDQLLD